MVSSKDLMELITSVHFQEIQVEGYKTLKEGASVTFEPGDGEKGPVAKHIVNV